MEQRFYGFSNQSDLEAYDDNGQIIEIDAPPVKVKNSPRGKMLPQYPEPSKNRDRVALSADILLAIMHYQNLNSCITKNLQREQLLYGDHALISQIHQSCGMVASKSRRLLADLRDNGLITTKEVVREKYSRNVKKDKINGNTAILIYITDKGRKYVESLKEIHKNYYPILKDCYMIKSGLVNL